MKRPLQLGLFGKLPSLGDFIQRDLPSKFVRPWDAWLSLALATSRETLGTHWRDAYLLSAPWRFVIEPDVLGDTGWGGVLVSSVDRVNRYYPMTVAVALEQHEASILWAHSHTSFYLVMEAAALDLIQDDRPLEDVLADANALAEAALTPESGADDALLSAQLMVPREIVHDDQPRSWWWSSHSDQSFVLSSHGLLPSASFAGLLDHDWIRHGWTDSTMMDIR